MNEDTNSIPVEPPIKNLSYLSMPYAKVLT